MIAFSEVRRPDVIARHAIGERPLPAKLLPLSMAAGVLKRSVRLMLRSVQVALRLWRLGSAVHPEMTLTNVKCRLKILGLWFTAQRELLAWFGIADNPQLDRALKQWPRIEGAVTWPYLHCQWTMAQRLQVIDRHYRMLDHCASVMREATTIPIELARLDSLYRGLRLVLDKANWFIREGEVVLNLFVNDRRLMSIAFTLGEVNGQRIAYVGALQGAHSSDNLDALALYREMTHALHGLRPRDLLVTGLKLLCAESQINCIHAISDDTRHHRSPYFGGAKMSQLLLNYDHVWIEHGGVRLDNGFFVMPTAVRRRERCEIPTHKRAAYRRRYEMLDALARDIHRACQRAEP